MERGQVAWAWWMSGLHLCDMRCLTCFREMVVWLTTLTWPLGSVTVWCWLLKDTSLPPKPKVAPQGLLSHAGAFLRGMDSPAHTP